MITHRHPEFGELITQPRVWQTDSGTWYVVRVGSLAIGRLHRVRQSAAGRRERGGGSMRTLAYAIGVGVLILAWIDQNVTETVSEMSYIFG